MAREKKKWRPRGGRPLTVEPTPGWIECKMVFVLGRVPKAFLYPPVGLMLATFIAFSGRGELSLRSYGLALVGLWLIVDLWNCAIRKTSRWKFVIGWTGSSLIVIAVMGVMWWWIDGKLKDQQDDVFQNLTSSVEMPAPGDAMNSFFTLTNGGKTGIVHSDFCGIHLIVGVNKQFVARVSVAGGFPYGTTLGASGVAQSTQCLQFLAPNVGTVACADVEFWVKYALETQPAAEKKKFFRFVGYRTAGQLVLVPEPPRRVSTTLRHKCTEFIEF